MAPKVCHRFSCVFLLSLFLPLLSYAHSAYSNGEEPSPFSFIKNFHGFKKGDNVKGLYKLKDYLQNFGYLSQPYSVNPTHVRDDGFDDHLESAIKTYQLNYRLNVTGMLDANTVSTMMMPRCGFPDIVNGTNWMQLGHQGLNSLHIAGPYYTFLGNTRWPNLGLTYALQPGTRKDAVSPIAQAFRKWASASRFKFTTTQDYNHADLKLSFQRRNHGDGIVFDGSGGILAHASPPTEGILHFDAEEHWVVGAVPGGVDMGSVALHEIGHLLGLGHSTVLEAVMYPTLAAGNTKGLSSDDIQGLKALYHF